MEVEDLEVGGDGGGGDGGGGSRGGGRRRRADLEDDLGGDEERIQNWRVTWSFRCFFTWSEKKPSVMYFGTEGVCTYGYLGHVAGWAKTGGTTSFQLKMKGDDDDSG